MNRKDWLKNWRYHAPLDFPRAWCFLVAVVRPVQEAFGPNHLKRVFRGTPREAIAGTMSLEWLRQHWWLASWRDRRIITREIRRKEDDLINGAPTDAEIRDFYKRAAVGKVTPEQMTEFENRLKLRSCR